MTDAIEPVILDDSLVNSDWVKVGQFDFPMVETVEDFERELMIPADEPARTEMLERMAQLVWVDAAPAPIREMLLAVKKSVAAQKMQVKVDAMIEVALAKASFGGDRSAAGRYAAEQRWKGHVKNQPTTTRQPSGFIGISKPATATSISSDEGARKTERYPSHMTGYALSKMLHEDMEEMAKRELGEERIKQMQMQGTSWQLQDLAIQGNRGTAKRVVVRDLTKGLMSLPDELVEKAFRQFGNDYPTGVVTSKERMIHEMVNQVVKQWSESSNDSNVVSLAIQRLVRQEFGLTDSAPASVVGEETQRYDTQAGEWLRDKPELARFVTAVIQQQYANTQAYFAAKGIKEVTLHRGKMSVELSTRIGKLPEGEKSFTAEVQLRPLSAFTADLEIADRFAKSQAQNIWGGGYGDAVRVTIRVPVSQIFSTPFTGIGCLPEEEIVVLGATTTAKVRPANLEVESGPGFYEKEEEGY